MSEIVNLYDAKTHFSALIERAAAEIVIAKAGTRARLVPYRPATEPRKPAHALG